MFIIYLIKSRSFFLRKKRSRPRHLFCGISKFASRISDRAQAFTFAKDFGFGLDDKPHPNIGWCLSSIFPLLFAGERKQMVPHNGKACWRDQVPQWLTDLRLMTDTLYFQSLVLPVWHRQ